MHVRQAIHLFDIREIAEAGNKKKKNKSRSLMVLVWMGTTEVKSCSFISLGKQERDRQTCSFINSLTNNSHSLGWNFWMYECSWLWSSESGCDENVSAQSFSRSRSSSARDSRAQTHYPASAWQGFLHYFGEVS